MRIFQQFCLLVIHNPTLVQARSLSLSRWLSLSLCVCVCGFLGPRCSSFLNGSPLIYCAKRVKRMKPSLPTESQQHFCAALISYSLPQRRDATHFDYNTAYCREARGWQRGMWERVREGKQLSWGPIKCQAKASRRRRTANLMHSHKSINFQNTISQSPLSPLFPDPLPRLHA